MATLRQFVRQVFDEFLGRAPLEYELADGVAQLDELLRLAFNDSSVDVTARYRERFLADYAALLRLQANREASREARDAVATMFCSVNNAKSGFETGGCAEG